MNIVQSKAQTLILLLMNDYYCTVCDHIYDPLLGDPENGIAPNTPFEELPDSWICPVCGEGKLAFAIVEKVM